LNTARTILSALALACASMAANAVTVDYSASIPGDSEFPGYPLGGGQFSGVDTNADGLLTMNELSAFTFNSASFMSSVTLGALNNFGSYDIAANHWTADTYVGGNYQNNYYFFSGTENDFKASAVYYSTVTTTVVPNAVPTAPVPEPETYAMMVAGLGVLGWMGRRRQAKKA